MGRRYRSAGRPGLVGRARFARRVPVARRRARARRGRTWRGRTWRPFARREGAARAHPLSGLPGRAARGRPARRRARSRSVPGLRRRRARAARRWQILARLASRCRLAPRGSRGAIKPRRTVGPRSFVGSRSAVRPRSAVGPRATGRSLGVRPHVARNVDETTRRIDGRRIQHLLPARAHAAAARSLTGAGTRRVGPGLLAAPRMGYFRPVAVAGGPTATRTRRPPDPDKGQDQEGNQANRDAHPAQGQAQAG